MPANICSLAEPESGGAAFLTPVKARKPSKMVRGLAIFDFDCTLTRFHVWGKYRNAPLKEVPIDAQTFVDIARRRRRRR